MKNILRVACVSLLIAMSLVLGILIGIDAPAGAKAIAWMLNAIAASAVTRMVILP